MALLATLREHDIFPERKPVADTSYPFMRDAVRMVLMDNEGRIAAIFYPKGEGTKGGYMLPGGGVDAPESVLQALAREAKEETGCEIESIEEIGSIMEYGVGIKTRHIQEEHLFHAKVKGQKGSPQPTRKEQSWKAEVRWLPFSELKAAIESQAPSFARSVALIALS